MKNLLYGLGALVAAVFASGCGRTGTICETATDCGPGETCTANGCVPVDGGLGGGSGGGFGGGTGGSGGGVGGGVGGGIGGGVGGGVGGGIGGGVGGGVGGGIGGGGGSNCRPGETQCLNGCTNTSIDVDNCGRCGRPCPEGANATATCSGGTCGLQCAPGFADCDLNPMNGCEANFSDPATCGACGNACPSGPNGRATCTMGLCGLQCAPGFGNCDFSAMNGCEADLSLPANCGACGNRCSSGINQLGTCMMGICGRQCVTGFADCDMFPATGCESNLSSPATCGSCSNACPGGGPNTMATCAGSTCGSQCRAGFGNCDGNLMNGCEADFNSPLTCGSCSNACASGQLCTNGACGGCPAGPVGVLNVNTTVMGTLVAGPARFQLPSCSMQSTRYEEYWTLNITTPSTVTLETGGTLDTVLFLRSTCSATTDLACNDDTPGLGTRSRIITTLQPGTYAVFVKQWGGNAMGGAYSLSATVSTASNSICTSATPLNPGVPLLGESSRNGGAPSSACFPAAGGQLFYRVLVGANQRALITTTAPSVSMTTRLLASCTATTCTSSVQGVGPQQVTFDNRSTATQTIIVSVSATTAGVNGSFDMLAEVGPIPTGSNITCTAATPLLIGGMPVTGEVIDTGGAPLSGSCLPGQTGRVRYFSIVVPSRAAVTVSASPDVFDLGLRVFTSCGATNTCAAFSDGVSSVGPESIRITNPNNFSSTFIVAASSSFAGSGGTFSIAATNASPGPAANAFCNTPTALPPGIAAAGEFAVTGGLPLHNLCLPAQSGYVRYYSVAVPPQNTMQAVITGGGVTGLDVGLRLLAGCAAPGCNASSDVSSGPFSQEAVIVSNTGFTTQNFLLATSAVNVNVPMSSTYNVLANVTPTSTNGVCGGATTIPVGGALMNESLAGGGPPNPACLPSTGLTKHYRFTLAPQERVQVRVTPSNFDANLRVFDACPGTTCVAAADVAQGVSPETVTLQNDNLSTSRTYWFAVSASPTTTGGSYSVSVTRTPYSLSRITASCNDLSLAPDLLGPMTMPVLSDDQGTGLLALPAGFSFPFFSMPATQYAVCMNGFAQLFPVGGGAPDCSFSNTTLPDAAPPSGMVAPLWDDLIPVPTTTLRSLVSGSAPNRVFTIQWFDAGFINGSNERLHFQTKLFETTGVLEFHYCSLQANGGPPDLVTGSGATIGLENFGNNGALVHSVDTASSISSGGGLRFTPQ